MDDVLAVMDAAGSERAAICGTLEGGPMAALFAATHPDRVSRAGPVRDLRARHLGARTTTGPGAPRSATREMGQLIEHWGEGLRGRRVAPSLRGRARASWSGRGGWSGWRRARARSRRIFDLIGEFDVRDVLPSIRVPTLVMHRARRQLHQGRALPLHGSSASRGRATSSSRASDNMFSIGDSEAAHRRDRGVPDRRRATSASPTACSPRCCSRTSAAPPSRAAELGDRGWRYLLERHDALFRQALDRHRGREVKRTGDGFLATFDGPGAGDPLRGLDLAEAVGSLGLADPGRAPHRRAGGDGRRPGRARRAHRRARDGARPGRARCSSRARSRTSWWALASSSRTGASTSCAACRANGACSP